MARKRKQSNTVRNILVLALVIVLLIVIAASYKSEQVPPKKDEASDYFAISGAAYFPSTGNGSTIKLTTLGFDITAVKGDANNVYVQCGMMEYPELVGDGTILQGQSVHVETYPNLELPAVGVGNEFYIEVALYSTEAEGEIPLILKQR